MNPTEDKIQDKYMAQNKVPSLDKSESASKTETEHTEKYILKKIFTINQFRWLKNGMTRTKRHDNKNNYISSWW